MPLRVAVLTSVLAVVFASSVAAQRTVRAADASVVAAAQGGETVAYAVIENGTMYDVYLAGAMTDAAQTVELVRITNDKPVTVKDVPIPAFDRLAMAPDGVHLRLKGLTRGLKAGDKVALALTLDNGDTLTIDATVK